MLYNTRGKTRNGRMRIVTAILMDLNTAYDIANAKERNCENNKIPNRN